MAKRYWLMKSEPSSFSIDDLKRAPGQTAAWDGVRNYQARNFLRDDMKPGDGVIIYHSNADPPGAAGTAEVVRAGYPDPTQFDPTDHHHDPASKPAQPRWYQVDVKWKSTFPRLLPLDELRAHSELAQMPLFHRSRLSIQPVTPDEWKVIVKLGRG